MNRRGVVVSVGIVLVVNIQLHHARQMGSDVHLDLCGYSGVPRAEDGSLGENDP